MVVETRAAVESGVVVLWKIEPDPGMPERLVMRDEAGAARFFSRDNGRTWAREGLAVLAGARA